MRKILVISSIVLLFTVPLVVLSLVSGEEVTRHPGSSSTRQPTFWQSVKSAFLPGPSSLAPVEYMAWVKDTANGLHVRKCYGEICYAVQYKPTSYVALQELKNPMPTSAELQAAEAQYVDLEYFTLSLTIPSITGEVLKVNVADHNEYSQRLLYLNTVVQQDLALVVSSDTLPCVLHHFERGYDVSPACNLLLAFPKSEENGKDKTLLFNDRMFGQRVVQLPISGTSLQRLPVIKTQAP